MEDSLTTAVALEIRGLRNSRRMTQPELAERTGISLSTIKRIEAATTDIDVRQISLITDVLQIEVAELFRRAALIAAK